MKIIRVLGLIVFLAFTLPLLTGCAQDTADSNQVAPGTSGVSGSGSTNNIDRDYNLLAREGSSEVSYTATFRLSGTWGNTIRLSAPAQLVFDGQKLEDSQLISKEGAILTGTLLPIFSPLLYLASGTHYSAQTYGMGPHQATWTDQTGRLFHDHLSVTPCTLLGRPTVISQGTAFTVSGPAGMTYGASLSQEKADHSSAYAGARSVSGTLTFDRADLARFEAAPAVLKVQCETKIALETAGSGRATGSSIYELREIPVTVVP